MADFETSLPVMSREDLDEKVQIKIVDFTDPDGANKQATVNNNLLHVKIFGSLTGGGFGSVQLNEAGAIIQNGVYNGTTNTIPSNIGVIGHVRGATPAATDQTIRLTAASPTADNVAPANIHALDTTSFMMGFDGTNWDRITATAGALNVNVANAIMVDLNGVYNVGTNPTPDTVGSIFHTRAATPDQTNQTFRATGGTASSDNVTPANVHALDTNSFGMVYDGTNWDRLLGFAGKAGVALFDEAGAAFTTSNPLPVQISENPGTEVTNFTQSLAVAGAATVNHDYTVTAATTLSLTQVLATCSGRIRADVKIETGVATNTFTTIGVFFNSTATPNISWEINPSIEVAAGVRVRITLTNGENQAKDIFSTVQGFEVA